MFGLAINQNVVFLYRQWSSVCRATCVPSRSTPQRDARGVVERTFEPQSLGQPSEIVWRLNFYFSASSFNKSLVEASNTRRRRPVFPRILQNLVHGGDLAELLALAELITFAQCYRWRWMLERKLEHDFKHRVENIVFPSGLCKSINDYYFYFYF